MERLFKAIENESLTIDNKKAARNYFNLTYLQKKKEGVRFL